MKQPPEEPEPEGTEQQRLVLESTRSLTPVSIPGPSPRRPEGGDRPPFLPAHSKPLPDLVSVPSIKGKITELLRAGRKRVGPTDEEMSFSDEGGNVVLRTGDERGAVALACLIVENLRRHGGSNVPSKALNNLLERLLRTLTKKEMMDIEVEAYEILLWLGSVIAPDLLTEDDAPASTGAIDYDPHESSVHLIRRAIREKFDLDMSYYTGGRGELTQRRITPRSLEAETYLHAFCHMRQDERVFRISRIGGVWPVRGRAVDPDSQPTAEESNSTQMELLPPPES